MEEGDQFPDFELSTHNGDIIRYDDLNGKRFVLFAYPRAMTSGCTKEVCSVRDYFQELVDRNITPLGISNDPPSKNKKFAEKHDLQYDLLSDEANDLLTKLGAYGDKKIYGKTVKGTFRFTYIVDENGIIRKKIKKVNTATHGEEILNALDELDL
jgi:peroxiredoxin Q/BCP